MKLTGTATIVCPECDGTGKTEIQSDDTWSGCACTCGICDGTGKVTIPLSDVESIEIETVEVENCGGCPFGLERIQCWATSWPVFLPALECATLSKRDELIRRVLEQAFKGGEAGPGEKEKA